MYNPFPHNGVYWCDALGDILQVADKNRPRSWLWSILWLLTTKVISGVQTNQWFTDLQFLLSWTSHNTVRYNTLQTGCLQMLNVVVSNNKICFQWTTACQFYYDVMTPKQVSFNCCFVRVIDRSLMDSPQEGLVMQCNDDFCCWTKQTLQKHSDGWWNDAYQRSFDAPSMRRCMVGLCPVTDGFLSQWNGNAESVSMSSVCVQIGMWESVGSVMVTSLQWRYNGREGVSNHQPHDCLLNRLFRLRSKKTWKLRVTSLCAGNSPGTGEFPAQMASYAENHSIWWRHHVNWCNYYTYCWRVPEASQQESIQESITNP